MKHGMQKRRTDNKATRQRRSQGFLSMQHLKFQGSGNPQEAAFSFMRMQMFGKRC